LDGRYVGADPATTFSHVIASVSEKTWGHIAER